MTTTETRPRIDEGTEYYSLVRALKERLGIT